MKVLLCRVQFKFEIRNNPLIHILKRWKIINPQKLDFVCFFRPEFTGADCDIPISVCTSNSCFNNGTCIQGVGAFTCSCPPGFTGQKCEAKIDACDSNPCHNGATCHSLDFAGYTCSCSAGFTGQDCATRINYCDNFACDNGGTCSNGLLSASCICMPGFSGVHCEVNIDECLSGPCLNGGRCVDKNNSFHCVCPTATRGRLCEEGKTNKKKKKYKQDLSSHSSSDERFLLELSLRIIRKN